MNAALRRIPAESSRPLAPLGVRRRAVLLTFGGYALVVLSAATAGLARGGELAWVAAALLGMILTATGAFQLMRPRRLGLPEGRDHQLDERQWQQLARAHTTAYRLLGVLLVVGTGYLYVASNNHRLPMPGTSFAWLTLYLGAALLLPTLPTAVLAWTEPDAPDEG